LCQLCVINSSCNFVVYCLFGATFRRIFLATVCACCGYRIDADDRAAAAGPRTVAMTTVAVTFVVMTTVAGLKHSLAMTTKAGLGAKAANPQSLSPQPPGKRRRWSGGTDADEDEAAMDGNSLPA